jgi:hypothetical protein
MTTATALAPLIGLVVIETTAVADFLTFSLPSLLADGNLPALSPRLQLRIVGEPAALAALQRTPAIVRAGSRFAASFIPQAGAVSWEAALADRDIRGLPVLRLDTRVIWSNGALPAIVAQLDAGMARVETICLPVGYDVVRPAFAERAVAPTPGFLARLVAREAASPKRRGVAQQRSSSGSDLYRRIGPSRFAVHLTDWDSVGEIAGGEQSPVGFLDNPHQAVALRLGRRSAPTRAALIRQLAASRPARERFRHRVAIGEGSPVEAEIAALDSELAEIAVAVDEALAETRCRLIIAAWTRPYIELFLRLTLPSLTTPGNLPRLESAERRIPVTMLCLAADRPACEQSPAFRNLARQRAIEWHCIDDVVAIFDDAREAILSQVLRQTMARHWDPNADLTFVLLRPGHVVADGTLPALMRPAKEGARAVLLPTPRAELSAVRLRLEDGAGGAAPRALARAVLDSAIEEALPLPLDGRMVRAVSDHIAIKETGRLSFRSARWHPAALRPAKPPQPGPQSLFGMDIVPEFAAHAGEIHRIANSDEALIVDVRTLPPRDAAELVAVGELAKRIGVWATDWHRRNLEVAYDVIAGDGGAASPARLLGDLPLPNGAPPVPARRHPAWLAAHGMSLISPQTGETARYTSDLDGYYRVARLAIEQAAAEEAIYAGHASHVFAPLLARCFDRAYLAKLDHLLVNPEAMRDLRRSTLYVLHLDLALFQSLCLTGRADRFFREPAASGQPIILIVESPDSHGGLIGLDVALAREWDARIARLADALGMQARLRSTLIEFFEGHPGFVVQITTKPAPGPRQSSPRTVAETAAAAALQTPVNGQ